VSGDSTAPRSLDWRTALLPWALLGPNLLWLALFMAGPLALLFAVSFKGYASGRGIIDTWQDANYVRFLGDPYNRGVLVTTLLIGLEVTALCLFLGFPLALGLSRARGWTRSLLYFGILMPLLTSAVVRTFGWMILLANNGFINRTLIATGLVDAPIRLMYNQTGVVIALAEVLLPFMVLALDASLLNIDASLTEAAQNLGAGNLRIFARITLPLVMPGIVSGSVLVFTLAISSFVTPALIGGARLNVMSTLIYQQSVTLLNWPFGAAIAFVMLFTILALLTLTVGLAERRRSA
jgi:putative spermidine/putrescine transport system permease protein